MKKRLLRMLAAAAVLLYGILAFACPASAARDYPNCINNCKLYDEAGMFDSVDREMLDNAIRETSDTVDMYVAVCVYGADEPQLSDTQVMNLADDIYDELFNPQYGEDSDGVLLVLYLSTRYAYISTCGMGQLYYTNGGSSNRVSKMIDNMTSYLRDENYSGAIQRFCSDLKSYYSSGVPKNAYTYDENAKLYYYESNGELVSAKSLPKFFGVPWQLLIGIGIVTGSIGALIAFLVVVSQYKLVKSLAPINYVSQQDTQFYVQDDIFLRTHTSKTRIDTDSGGRGGGGGGSSHMSSGGHSHGGGGGHW